MDNFISFMTENINMIFLIAGLVIAICASFRVVPKKKILFTLHTLFFVIIMIVSEKLDDYFEALGSLPGGDPSLYINIRTALTMIDFMCYPFILLCLILMYETNRKVIITLVIPCFINLLVYATAFFWDVTFKINEDGTLVLGRLGYFVYIILVLYAIYLIISFYFYHKKKKKQLIIYGFIAIIVVVCTILTWIDGYNNSTTLNTVILAGLFFYYMSFVIIRSKFTIDNQKSELKNKQNEIMVSQIKPHFIYNTLNTIYALVDEDVDKAKETIDHFAEYLKVNLDLKNENIPFEDEIKHCQNYAEIEMCRFKNIKVLFEIDDKDFKLPPLTVQPMIENAIKHGVRSRPEGWVKVRSYLGKDDHIVQIIDNGVGFTTNSANKPVSLDTNKEEHAHIGVENVKTRIEEMCNGTFEIYSVPNQGTTITFKIPREY